MVLNPPENKPASNGASQTHGWPVEAVLERIRSSARETVRDGALDLNFQALGTRCRVSLTTVGVNASQVAADILRWLAAFEAKYSRFLPDSLISRINAAAGGEPLAIDPETQRLFALCDQMHFITKGIFDPTALPLLRAWNWKAERPVVPSPAEVAAARELVGWRKVRRSPGHILLPQAGMGLDLGGMGKEYAVDCVAEMLAAAGVRGALVDFGADVRVLGLPADGRPGWHIGLDDPLQPGRCWCGLGVRQGAVATSGDYFRAFEHGGRRYGHILDLRTGFPVDNGCRAVSVLAPSCTIAGMLSTAAFVLGPEEGMKLIDSQYGASAAIVCETGKFTSRHFYEHVVS